MVVRDRQLQTSAYMGREAVNLLLNSTESVFPEFWEQLELKSHTDSINSKSSTRKIKKPKKFNPPLQVCPILFHVWVPALNAQCVWWGFWHTQGYCSICFRTLRLPLSQNCPSARQEGTVRAGMRLCRVTGWLWPPPSHPLCSTGGSRALICWAANQAATGGNGLMLSQSRQGTLQWWNSLLFVVPSLTVVL